MNDIIHRRIFFFLIAAGSLAFALYCYFSNLPFLSDDYFLLLSANKNPFPIFGDWVGSKDNMYRPLVVLSFFLQLKVFGYHSFSFYLVNLLLHIGNSLLICFVIKRILHKYFGIANSVVYIIPLLFFFSIQGWDNVTWIAGRTDLLCAVFGFTALTVYANTKGKMNSARRIGIIAALLLSLMSKETGLLFLGFLFVMIAFDPELNRRQKFTEIAVLIGVFFIYAGYRYNIFGNHYVGSEEEVLTAKFWIYGLSALFIPVDNLDIYYGLLVKNIWVFLFIAFGIAAAIFLLMGFMKSAQKKAVVLLLLISMISMLIYLGYYPSSRLMYIHTLPLLVAYALLLNEITNRLRNVTAALLLVTTTLGAYPVFINLNLQNNYITRLSATVKSAPQDQGVKNILFPELFRVSQRYSLPYIRLSSYFWTTGSITGVNNNWRPLIFFETYSLSPCPFDYKVQVIPPNKMILTASYEADGFVPHANSDSVFNPDNRWIDSIATISFSEFRQFRKRLAGVCAITFNEAYLAKNPAMFIYCNRDEIERLSFKSLMQKKSLSVP
jgi:hypothetical protein